MTREILQAVQDHKISVSKAMELLGKEPYGSVPSKSESGLREAVDLTEIKNKVHQLTRDIAHNTTMDNEDILSRINKIFSHPSPMPEQEPLEKLAERKGFNPEVIEYSVALTACNEFYGNSSAEAKLKARAFLEGLDDKESKEAKI